MTKIIVCVKYNIYFHTKTSFPASKIINTDLTIMRLHFGPTLEEEIINMPLNQISRPTRRFGVCHSFAGYKLKLNFDSPRNNIFRTKRRVLFCSFRRLGIPQTFLLFLQNAFLIHELMVSPASGRCHTWSDLFLHKLGLLIV